MAVDKFGNTIEDGLRDNQGNLVPGFIPPMMGGTAALIDFINPQTGQRVTAPSGGYTPPQGFVVAGQPNTNQPVQAPRLLPSEPIVPGAGSNISAVQAFLNEGLRQAQSLFLTGQQPTFFPGQTYVSPSAASADALTQQEALARQQNPLLQQAQQAYQTSLGQVGQTAGGSFLMGNPYQAQMIQAATRPLEQAFSNQILPNIASLYSKSGRLGSGAMERALSTATEAYTRGLGDISSNIAGTQFQSERALQEAAQRSQATLAQAAPSIYGQQFLPSQALGQVGAQQEAISNQALQEQISRFGFGQQLPYQQLQGYLSSVYGTPVARFGEPAPLYQNRAAGGLGGALAGGIGGYALGQAFPQIGAGYGAAGGAALGGLLGGGFF